MGIEWNLNLRRFRGHLGCAASAGIHTAAPARFAKHFKNMAMFVDWGEGHLATVTPRNADGY